MKGKIIITVEQKENGEYEIMQKATKVFLWDDRLLEYLYKKLMEDAKARYEINETIEKESPNSITNIYKREKKNNTAFYRDEIKDTEIDEYL